MVGGGEVIDTVTILFRCITVLDTCFLIFKSEEKKVSVEVQIYWFFSLISCAALCLLNFIFFSTDWGLWLGQGIWRSSEAVYTDCCYVVVPITGIIAWH